MSSPRQPRDGIRTLTEAKALAALAHPFRARIIDALQVDGPSTASALAKRTGQAVGNASHHLKVLAEAALVQEAPDLARDKRERWWQLVDRGQRWSTAELTDPAAAAAAQQAALLYFHRQVERTQSWLANAETDPTWDDAAFANQSWLKLTPEELSGFAEEILDVVDRWSRREIPDDGQARESVFWFGRAFPSQP